MDIAIGATSWWIMGHAIANGDDSFANSGVNGVFGTSGFGYIDAATVGKRRFGGQAEWFFGLSFAATSATIVSGAIAERCNMIPYFLLACLLTSFVYPVVAHVAWHESGRLSAYRDERLAFGCGLLDFAGGGVVHLTGGVAALAAAGNLEAKSGKILMTSELATEYGFVDATGAMPVGGMASGAGVEAQAFFRSLLGKTPPFGGELGDFSQTNNEGVKACFHGY